MLYILYVAAKLLFQSDFFHFKINMNKTTVLAFYHLILSKTWYIQSEIYVYKTRQEHCLPSKEFLTNCMYMYFKTHIQILIDCWK